ncbi:MAG: phosphoribosyl-AMP cyclohydrolase [Gammaproteobacteria bacterium]|nr:phosphoribosyl-AMP cyclohydrolase [Gammaproteobacteria bacterium]
MSAFLDVINWNEDGLIPVITIDASSNRLLMQAWANREAVATAVAERRGVYWSRSRQRLWRKGEQSGNVQKLVEVLLDCDNDSLCYRVEQVGDVACHTGRISCFYRRLVNGVWEVEDKVIVDPATLYK